MRKHDFYLIDLTKNKLKACCKTPFYKETNSISQDMQLILSDRENLKAGHKIESCSTCWELEAHQFKSFRSTQAYNPRQKMAGHAPFIVEFSIGNSCNLKCVYCNSDSSSKWGTLKKNPTMTSEIKHLLESWWQDAEFFNLIGGEPLLISTSFEILDTLKEIALKFSSNRKKNISIISNLAVPTRTFKNFMNKLEPYLEFFEIEIGASAESLGDQYEYIRDGAVFDVFCENFETLIQFKGIHVSLINTLSLLTIQGFHHFLKFFVDKLVEHEVSMSFVFNEVVFPKELSPRLFPKSLKNEAKEALDLLQKIPPKLIRFKSHFARYLLNLAALYTSLEDRTFPEHSCEFLELSESGRLNSMSWKECFPDLLQIKMDKMSAK